MFIKRRSGRPNMQARLVSIEKRFGRTTTAAVKMVLRGNRRILGTIPSLYEERESFFAQWLLETASLQFPATATAATPYVSWLAARINRQIKLHLRVLKRQKAALASPEDVPYPYPGLYDLDALLRSLFDNWGRIVDWASHHREDLGARSVADVVAATTLWHDTLPRNMETALLKGEIGQIIASWPDGWSFQRISFEEGKRESAILDHCVWSRYKSALSAGEIYSLRDEKNVPWVTVRICDKQNPAQWCRAGEVEQVKGYRDATAHQWTEEDFENWAPRLIEGIEKLQPNHAFWEPEAEALTGLGGGWMALLLAGNFRGAEEFAPAEAARTISNFHAMIEGGYDDDGWPAETAWEVVDGTLKLSWTQDLDDLQEAGGDLQSDDTFKEELAKITPEQWATLVDGAIVFPGFEAADPHDEGELRGLVRQALGEAVVGYTFRVANYQIKPKTDWGRKNRSYPPHLEIDPDHFIDEVGQTTVEGEEYAASGTAEWDINPDPEYWIDGEYIWEDLSELQEWRYSGISSEDYLDSHTIEDRFKYGLKAMLEYVPRPIRTRTTRMEAEIGRDARWSKMGAKQRWLAFHEALERRGQLRLPFKGRSNRRGQRRLNRYQARMRQWRKHLITRSKKRLPSRHRKRR